MRNLGYTKPDNSRVVPTKIHPIHNSIHILTIPHIKLIKVILIYNAKIPAHLSINGDSV